MIRLVLVIRLLALVAVAATILKGCGVIFPRPFPCDRFSESRWQEYHFGVDTLHDVIATTMKVWDIERKRIHSTFYAGGDLRVAWSDDARFFSGSGHSAWFREDRILYRIWIAWDNPKPTLSQVINCLGFPDFYEAYFEQGPHARGLVLNLWYGEKGLIVSRFSIHYRESTPAISPRHRMESFTVVAPGSLEEMARNASGGSDDPSWQAYILCLLRPWPGSIEEMEVERFIESRRCGKS